MVSTFKRAKGKEMVPAFSMEDAKSWVSKISKMRRTSSIERVMPFAVCSTVSGFDISLSYGLWKGREEPSLLMSIGLCTSMGHHMMPKLVSLFSLSQNAWSGPFTKSPKIPCLIINPKILFDLITRCTLVYFLKKQIGIFTKRKWTPFILLKSSLQNPMILIFVSMSPLPSKRKIHILGAVFLLPISHHSSKFKTKGERKMHNWSEKDHDLSIKEMKKDYQLSHVSVIHVKITLYSNDNNIRGVLESTSTFPKS